MGERYQGVGWVLRVGCPITRSHKTDPLRAVVEALATALDHDDYEGAHGLLHPEVVYELGDETLHGPDAIVESYRSSSEMAHGLFDTVGYGHEIAETDGPTFTVDYRDVLTVDGETHTHYARQEITVGPDGDVVRIVDRPVPGERAKVDEFMARHDLTRPDH